MVRRSTLRVRELLAALLFASACGGAQTSGANAGDTTSARTAQATDFALRTTDGKTVHLSDHLGKDVILLNFWATWCAPCAGELPHLQRIYDEHKAKGFVVLAISMDGPKTVANVRTFINRLELTFPVLLDEETRVASEYNPTAAAPHNVIIDRKGSVVFSKEGYHTGDEKILAAKVAELVAQ